MEKYSIITQTQEEYEKSIQSLNSVNLEQIVAVQFNEEALQANFKVISDVIRKQFGLLNVCKKNMEDFVNELEADNRLKDLDDTYQKLKDQLEEMLKQNENVKKQMEQVKDKGADEGNQANKEEKEEMERKVNGLEDLIKQIKELADQQPDNTVNVQQQDNNEDKNQDDDKGYKDLYDQLEDLQKRANMIQIDNQRIREVKENTNNGAVNAIDQKLDDLNVQISKMENQILNKVNCEDFDNLIASMSAGNKTGDNQGIAVTSSKDQNRINQVGQKVKDNAAIYNKLIQRLDNLKDKFGEIDLREKDNQARNETRFKQLLDKLQEIENELLDAEKRTKKVETNKLDKNELGDFNKDKLRKEMMDIIGKLKEAVSHNSHKLDSNNNEIEDLKRKIDSLMKKMLEMERKMKSDKNGIDLSVAQKQIEEENNKLRNEILQQLQNLEKQLEKKMGSEDDLLNYQQKIFQKIDEIVGALVKQLANKNETKKALLYLEKKITELYLLINPENKEKGELEQLLNKKPLFWSCASCDKDMDQYQGKLGDYRTWKVFPPKETDPEKMGRFGIGYAQMMQNRKFNLEKEKEIMKDKNINGSEMNNTKQQFNNTHSSVFPDIKDEKKYKK